MNRASSILIPDDIEDFITPLLPQVHRAHSNKRPKDSLTLMPKKAVAKREESERPPAVPPKSPRMKLKLATQAPIIPQVDRSRVDDRQATDAPISTPITAPEGRASPKTLSTPWQSPRSRVNRGMEEKLSPPGQSASPSSYQKWIDSSIATQNTPKSGSLARSASFAMLQRTRSNSNISHHYHESAHRHKRENSEGSVLDRGRPTQRKDGFIKRKLTIRTKESLGEFGHLPQGTLANLASTALSIDEIDALYEQARGQVEHFQVLKYKDVKALSRVSET